jgi:hypothetical protein
MRLRGSHGADVDLTLAKIFAIDLAIGEVVEILLGKLHIRVGSIEPCRGTTFATQRTLARLAQLA